jgi:carboxypeptidase Taq
MYPPAFLLAVQFDKAIQNEITGLDKQLEKGDSSKVVDWWRRNVFNHGSRYTSHELIQSSTGSLPNPDLYIPFHKSLTEGVRKIAAQTINPK